MTALIPPMTEYRVQMMPTTRTEQLQDSPVRASRAIAGAQSTTPMQSSICMEQSRDAAVRTLPPNLRSRYCSFYKTNSHTIIRHLQSLQTFVKFIMVLIINYVVYNYELPYLISLTFKLMLKVFFKLKHTYETFFGYKIFLSVSNQMAYHREANSNSHHFINKMGASQEPSLFWTSFLNHLEL